MEEQFQIQCFTCENWFFSQDVGISLEGYIPYMTNYEYCCMNCGEESIWKKPASFIQVGITALANLTSKSIECGDARMFFSLENEIIPFVWEHWDNICTKRSKAGNWRSNLATKLSTETRIFCESEEGSDEFGLVDQDLSAITPKRYESKTVTTKGVGKVKRKAAVDSNPVTTALKKNRGEREVSSRGLSHGYPLEHPYNKDGYRYILAEKDPHAVVDMDPEEMAGRAIPPELYRPYMQTEVLLALHDRAPQLKVAENRLTVTGEKGYCMIRATHGVSYGSWYFEVHIDDLDSVPESTVRLGWSQSLGNLQAPCGYDKLSYSWRSKFGTRFHQSHGKHYSDGFGTGDTVGFLIVLPQLKAKLNHPPTHKDKVLIKFKNFFYFEEKDEPVEEFDKIVFYKNGVFQGVAWKDIFAGRYYPALSFYKAATVTANMGPDFKFPPSDSMYRPMSEAAEVNAIEQTMSELLFHVDSNITRDSPPL